MTLGVLLAYKERKIYSQPIPSKIVFEFLTFLQRIQGDIYRPIHPSSGSFNYFIIWIGASTQWSHIYLSSTRNVAFARLVVQIIVLRVQFLDYLIKSLRLVNKFTSKKFDYYCTSTGIDIEHLILHVHAQNRLVE